jgi:hypothetical protein
MARFSAIYITARSSLATLVTVIVKSGQAIDMKKM